MIPASDLQPQLARHLVGQHPGVVVGVPGRLLAHGEPAPAAGEGPHPRLGALLLARHGAILGRSST